MDLLELHILHIIVIDVNISDTFAILSKLCRNDHVVFSSKFPFKVKNRFFLIIFGRGPFFSLSSKLQPLTQLIIFC